MLRARLRAINGDHVTQTSPPRKGFGYYLSMGFGLLFMAFAVLMAAMLMSAPHPVLGLLVAILFGALGIDLMVSTARGKRSWASRIGPLP
jgi:uncharacterized membrane protein YczE